MRPSQPSDDSPVDESFLYTGPFMDDEVENLESLNVAEGEAGAASQTKGRQKRKYWTVQVRSK